MKKKKPRPQANPYAALLKDPRDRFLADGLAEIDALRRLAKSRLASGLSKQNLDAYLRLSSHRLALLNAAGLTPRSNKVMSRGDGKQDEEGLSPAAKGIRDFIRGGH